MHHVLPYRPGVGIMLFNDARQVFVAKRIDMTSEAWQMPQGGIDEGEDPQTTALRELEEETGVPPSQVRILAQLEECITYDLPDALIPKVWGGKYRGQRQHWFAMQLLGGDACINIHTAEPEFSEWKWAPLHELPKLIVPFKRAMYEELVTQFSARLGFDPQD